MASISASTVRRHGRRSTRGLSLLQNSLLESIPTGIPADERLRILLRRCFKRALEEINDEIEPFQELHHTFLVEGLQLFDDTGDDDSLTTLLKAATELAPVNKSTVDIVAKHHEQLKSFSAECKRWNELLTSEKGLAHNEQCVQVTAKTSLDRQRYYDSIVHKADRSRRAAFQYASGVQTMLALRDRDACERDEITCAEVDVASLLDM